MNIDSARYNQKGITLIEILLVVIIISVIAGIVFLVLGPKSHNDSARDGVSREKLRELAGIIETYKTVQYSYPIDTNSDGNLINDDNGLEEFLRVWPSGTPQGAVYSAFSESGKFAISVNRFSKPGCFVYCSNTGQIIETSDCYTTLTTCVAVSALIAYDPDITGDLPDDSEGDEITDDETTDEFPFCGDTVCNGSETCSACQNDCGECPPQPCINTPQPPTTSYNLSTGLIGYWKFDESSWVGNCVSVAAMDSSGLGNHGSACPNKSPASLTSGKFGSAAYFDGINDYLDFGDKSVYELGGKPFTFSAWINLSSLASTPYHGYMVLAKDGGEGAKEYRWQVEEDDKLVFFKYKTGFASGTGIEGYAQPAPCEFTPPDIGQWFHAVFTLDVDGTHHNYLNGALVSSGKFSDSIYFNGSGPFVIGGLPNNGGYHKWFHGKIDDVRVYNRVLTPEQVTALYYLVP